MESRCRSRVSPNAFRCNSTMSAKMAVFVPKTAMAFLTTTAKQPEPARVPPSVARQALAQTTAGYSTRAASVCIGATFTASKRTRYPFYESIWCHFQKHAIRQIRTRYQTAKTLSRCYRFYQLWPRDQSYSRPHLQFHGYNPQNK